MHGYNVKKAFIAAVCSVLMVPATVYAAGQITQNTVKYDRNNTAIQGTYAEPVKDDGSTFLGWSTDPDATSAQYTQSTLNNYLPIVNGGDTKTLYAVWKAPAFMKYAVSIYGIDADGDHTITFGPATGGNYVTTSKAAHIEKSVETSSDMCIHNHTWDETIAQIKAGNETAFNSCIANGCTASVKLTPTDTLKSTSWTDTNTNAETGDGTVRVVQ